MARKFGFYLLGNGVTVAYAGTEKRIAHIAPDRSIRYHKRPTKRERVVIEDFAAHEDPSVSASQSEKVFESRPEPIGTEFSCDCGGEIQVVSETRVIHTCRHTSMSYGVDVTLPYVRVQVNPELTEGKVKYNWYVDWD